MSIATTSPVTAASAAGFSGGAPQGTGEFITITVGDQLFGIPVLSAQDVLHPQRIYRIPLAPPEVAGSLNLRGRIVTAIDLRVCLGLPPVEDPSQSMSVVVEHDRELYSLLVDSVGEVLRLPAESFERSPATLRPQWRDLCDGIYRLEGQLLLVLNVVRLLGGSRAAEAA